MSLLFLAQQTTSNIRAIWKTTVTWPCPDLLSTESCDSPCVNVWSHLRPLNIQGNWIVIIIPVSGSLIIPFLRYCQARTALFTTTANHCPLQCTDLSIRPEKSLPVPVALRLATRETKRVVICSILHTACRDWAHWGKRGHVLWVILIPSLRYLLTEYYTSIFYYDPFNRVSRPCSVYLVVTESTSWWRGSACDRVWFCDTL